MYVATLMPACTGFLDRSQVCDPGRVSLDGSCIAQPVADFIMCIRSRGNVELATERAQKFAVEVKSAAVSAGSADEARDSLKAKYSSEGGQATEQAIVARCAEIVGANRSQYSQNTVRGMQTMPGTSQQTNSKSPAGPCSGSPHLGVAYVGAQGQGLSATDRVRIEPFPRKQIDPAGSGYVELVVNGQSVPICGPDVVQSSDGTYLWWRPEGFNAEKHMMYFPVEPPGSSVDIRCRYWVKSGLSGSIAPFGPPGESKAANAKEPGTSWWPISCSQ